MAEIRLLPAGEAALLLEAPDELTTRALFEALQQAQFTGVTALRPAARTILLTYDPLCQTQAGLRQALRKLQPVSPDLHNGRIITIPMHYDGPDLADVAALMDIDIPALIARHQAATFTVAFTGFAPGFGYMTYDDTAFDLPRRATPRPSIRAGAVALAGRYGAVYPSDSPGGWQIIGHTDVVMWDTDRAEPALLRAGDRVRFIQTAHEFSQPAKSPAMFAGDPALAITHTLLPVTLQDRGRAGREGDGIPPSGAMDGEACARVNSILGNHPDAAVVEVTAPITLTALRAETLAFTGAAMPLTLQTLGGKSIALDQSRAFAVDAGDSLVIGAATNGTYGYLGRRGGFAAPKTLGARSHDTLSGIGPKPLHTNDMLYLADEVSGSVDPDPPPAPPCPQSGDTITLPLLPGPRMDWFTKDSLILLQDATWTITPAISRVGLRLSGPALHRERTGELASEAVIPGSIQVPHDGNPLIFMRDAPVTGGYPVIGIIPQAALSRLAQCPPGTRLRFALQTPFAPETFTIAPATDLP